MTTQVEQILPFLDRYPSLDREYVISNVTQYGLQKAAQIIGCNVSSYYYLRLSGILLMLDLQNTCPKTVREYSEIFKNRLNKKTYDFMAMHADALQKIIIKENDYKFDYLSASNMIKTYLAHVSQDEQAKETPQMLYLRIATHLYLPNFLDVKKCYLELSEHLYTPASPSLFNCGMSKSQGSSCFLMSIADTTPSILYQGLGDAGTISTNQGGLGMDISRLRHSKVGAVYSASGIIPVLQMYNAMIRWADQGGLRKGAATIFLRVHHIDVEDFIDAVKEKGSRHERVTDLNTCLWIPWLFWRRVRDDAFWTLMDPNRTMILNDLWGPDFEKEYVKLEQDSNLLPKKVVKARDLLNRIIQVQREKGMPYMMSSDSVNMKCNQKNLGYIRCSNLCLEITEFSSENEYASCNLSSISLRKFALGPITSKSYMEAYDFQKLGRIVASVVNNLNRVIDTNYYPLDEKMADGSMRRGKIFPGNKKNRPIGIGVSGLAEAYHILDIAFESNEAREINILIFACMYFNALAQSVQLAILEGKYETFDGSPFSHGKLQFDLWADEFELRKDSENRERRAEDDIPVGPTEWGQSEITLTDASGMFNVDVIKPTWIDLKRCIMKYGTRNSLLLALMPTATTSSILRNCETTEAHQSNLYSRKLMNGAYPCLNRFLFYDLLKLNLWTPETVSWLKNTSGSIQNLTDFVKASFPLFSFNAETEKRLKHLEEKYKTMWEIKQKNMMKMTAQRGRYIDQSQSTNIYLADPSDEQLQRAHMLADLLGLKTGMYYLRQKAAIESAKYTVSSGVVEVIEEKACRRDNPDCLSCT